MKVMSPEINQNGYIFLYRSEQNPKNLPIPRGIANIGNTCYFNSIIQLLKSTYLVTNNQPGFSEFIKFINIINSTHNI